MVCQPPGVGGLHSHHRKNRIMELYKNNYPGYFRNRGGKGRFDWSLLTVAEVAKLLKVSRSSVYEWIRKDELPVVKLGSSTRLTRFDVEEFVQRQRQSKKRRNVK